MKKGTVYILMVVLLLSNVNLALAKEVWNLSLFKANPSGNIVNSDNIAVFEDETVRIRCVVKDVDLTLGDIFIKKMFPIVTITNLSSEVLVIDWNSASFIGPDNKAHRVVYEGIKFIKATDELPPVTLAPSSQFETVVVPADSIYYSSISNSWIVSSPFTNTRNQSFTIVLPIKKKDQTIYYTLDYLIIVLQELEPPKSIEPPKSLKDKRIRVGIDTIPLGYYISTGENGEPNLLAGLSLNMFIIPGVSFRKYFKIAEEAFFYGELGVALILPYVGVGAVYTNQNGFEAGLGINLYPGADDYGNFLVLPFPNFILSVRF